MKGLRYRLEAAALWLALHLFRRLGIQRASALGGFLGRRLGPLLAGRNRIARRNLQAAFPGIEARRMAAILAGMWDNLGRVVAELPHIHDLDGARVETVSAVDLDRIAARRAGVIFFGAHFGNFDVATRLAARHRFALTMVYRRANNPLVERVVAAWRNKRGGAWAPKGREGARALLAALRDGGAIAIMADQKFNQGLAIPFFGRDAMTAPAIAELALERRVPLYPVRVLRRPGAHFQVTVFPALNIARSGDRQADIRAVLVAINRLLEDWIRERPDHWLWLHRRWPC